MKSKKTIKSFARSLRKLEIGSMIGSDQTKKGGKIHGCGFSGSMRIVNGGIPAV